MLATDRAARRSPCFAVHGERVLFGLGAHDVVAQDRTLARIRPQAIFDYLYAHVIVAPDTVYEHVQRLRPGEYVTIERGSVRRRLYWEPEYAEDGGPRDFRSAKQELVHLLEASVAQEVGPGKPGAFLSGGTDSSTIAGMLGRVTGQPAYTYSIGFEAQGYDEMAYARIAARHFRTRHREYYVTPDDLVAAVPLVARSYDQPFGNSSALPAFLCAQMAKVDGITRLLGGDGGDEIFGGNSRYAFQKVFDAYGRYAPPGADELVEAMLLRPQFVKRIPVVRRMRSYVEKAKLPVVTRMQVYNVLRQVGIESIFTPEFLQLVDPNAPAREEAAHYDSCTAASLVNRMLYFDWKYTLADNDLPKVVGTCDLAQIAVGFPFLDERLVEFANGLPPEWKVKRLRLRWFFKRALSDFLPREIIAKKKHGFGLPFGLWLVKHPGLQHRRVRRDGIARRARRGAACVPRQRAQGAAAGARGVLRRDRVDHDDARALAAGAPSRLCARAGSRGRVSALVAADPTPGSAHGPVVGLDQDLGRRRVAQERRRARGEAVGAGLEHHDEVPWCASASSMRSASRSSGVHSGPTTEAISRVGRCTRLPIDDRIVLADHLAEVAGRREMMVQAAVGDEEDLAARDLAVDDAADVDAGFADQVAAEFDDELRAGQSRRRALRRCSRRLSPIGARSSGCSPGKYGMPKPPPMLSTRTGAGAHAASRTASSTVFCCASQIASGAQVLRAAEDVEALEREARVGRSRASSCGHALGVDAELLRPAAHLHARRLQLEVGIDAHRDARGQAQLAATAAASSSHLAHRLDVDQDARARPPAQVRLRSFPGPRS